MMTRHASIMHLNFTGCQLNRDEVLFLGLALSMSKTLLSLHLSGNSLPYYDRIFLRTLVAAKVGFKFSMEGMYENKIKNNKEFT
jgi:hypothetical protein